MARDSNGKSPPGKHDREERLAAALRANLRRRKAQARGRGEKEASAEHATEYKPAAKR
jgi:hypothetical protein